MPITKNFRGANVDPLTYDFLVDLAANSGDIYIDPIDGYGSYADNAASADIDGGGGHVDINAENMTDAEARHVETLCRMRGGSAFFRPKTWYSPSRQRWITPGWQRHIHVILMGVPDISDAARVQTQEYIAGGDGLVGSDPDTGNRNYIHMTWQKYLAEKKESENSFMSVQPVNPSTGKPVTFLEYTNSTWKYDLLNHLLLKEIAAKAGVAVADVDEAALAKNLLPYLVDPIKSAVLSVVSESAPVGAVSPEQIAEAVVADLTHRLSE